MDYDLSRLNLDRVLGDSRFTMGGKPYFGFDFIAPGSLNRDYLDTYHISSRVMPNSPEQPSDQLYVMLADSHRTLLYAANRAFLTEEGRFIPAVEALNAIPRQTSGFIQGPILHGVDEYRKVAVDIDKQGNLLDRITPALEPGRAQVRADDRARDYFMVGYTRMNDLLQDIKESCNPEQIAQNLDHMDLFKTDRKRPWGKICEYTLLIEPQTRRIAYGFNNKLAEYDPNTKRVNAVPVGTVVERELAWREHVRSKVREGERELGKKLAEMEKRNRPGPDWYKTVINI